MRYHVVCFDVGFTLINERIHAEELLTEILAEVGHTADAEALKTARQATNRWYLQRYHTLGNDDWASNDTIRALWLQFYEQLFSQLDPTLDHADLGDRLIAHYEAPDNWVIYDDVMPTLETLKAQHIKMGVVSDWGTSLRPILHAHGLSRYFDFVVGSADAGHAKPTSELYSLAVTRANVPAERMIHIGDSYYADVLGARSVGMDAALIDRQQRAPKTDCPILHDLRELLTM
ncbi:MAG: HAD-IA family hydrolase [Herpetosiphon sp.]|nr:HAD-IA family hydrolase [Herpetosiphon sp.]